MQAIGKLTDTAIQVVLPASAEAFVPLLRARQPLIAQTPKRTFKYGSTDRHKLDVYYPPDGTSNAPILFFVYGGGFVSGERSPIPGLLYENIGSFFAQRGILTVIADYRLAPATVYPGPVHDVRAAIQFALSSSEVSESGDKGRVYVMGHSAGGAHTATLFLNEEILREGERAPFKGAVLSCAAFENANQIAPYYGEPASEADSKTPLGLLKSKSPDRVKQLLPPRVLFLSSENDVPGIIRWGETFQGTLREKGVTDFQEYTMHGHNHISPNFALNSGEGEEWGEELVKWIKA